MVRALWFVGQSERTYFSHCHYCPDEPHRILAISPVGTKLPIRDLRSLVAIEVEVDSARTSSDRRK